MYPHYIPTCALNSESFVYLQGASFFICAFKNVQRETPSPAGVFFFPCGIVTRARSPPPLFRFASTKIETEDHHVQTVPYQN